MIVFDLDGTLVDSASEILNALEDAWQAVMGSTFPRERVRIGPPLLDAIAALCPTEGRPRVEAIAAAFRERYDASDFSATVPYPGVREAVERLWSSGRTLCVATNKRRAPTLRILARWFPDRFTRLACIDGVWPEDGSRPGSKSGMLAWLLRTGLAETANVVMVGDTIMDVEAARAAGVRSIAVTWGYGEEAVLAAAHPDELVHDVRQLLAAV